MIVNPWIYNEIWWLFKVKSEIIVQVTQTKMWNILNIKSPKEGVHLNVPNRLQFLQNMENSFSEMNPRSIPGQMRNQLLTVDTSEALSLTLNGLV